MNEQSSQPEVNALPMSGKLCWRILRCVERIIALSLAFLLLKSSLAHIANPYEFLSSIYSYQLVGPEFGPWVAILTPFLQLTAGIGILIRWYAIENYLLGILLFSIFVAVQVSALNRNLEISCGCFGGIGGDVVSSRTIAVAVSY